MIYSALNDVANSQDYLEYFELYGKLIKQINDDNSFGGYKLQYKDCKSGEYKDTKYTNVEKARLPYCVANIINENVQMLDEKTIEKLCSIKINSYNLIKLDECNSDSTKQKRISDRYPERGIITLNGKRYRTCNQFSPSEVEMLKKALKFNFPEIRITKAR